MSKKPKTTHGATCDAGCMTRSATCQPPEHRTKYRYDPFGNTVWLGGSLAEANTYRFSSKEFHVASGMYYYGHRFYAPSLQRWMNSDPIEEDGGVNLYGVLLNDPLDRVDSDGRDWWPPSKWPVWGKPKPKPPKDSPPSKPSQKNCPDPEDPKSCWPSGPSSKLPKLRGTRQAACLALKTGCETCCAEKFFNKGDKFDQCIANCEARYTACLVGPGPNN